MIAKTVHRLHRLEKHVGLNWIFFVFSVSLWFIFSTQNDHRGTETQRNKNLRNLWMVLFSKPTDGPAGQINPNALHLRVKVERVPAHLAPVA